MMGAWVKDRRGVVLCSVVAGMLVLIGVVVLLTAAVPAQIGWFAYARLQEVNPSSALILITGQRGLGLALVVLGLLLAAALVGHGVGRSRSRCVDHDDAGSRPGPQH